jgi:integrase
MASPYRHPKTGSYYLRRKLPQDVRHAFNDSELFKVSLNTKDLGVARTRFVLANADLEKRIIEARAGTTYSPEITVKQWFAKQKGDDKTGHRRKTVLLMRLDLAVSTFDADLDKTEKHLRPIRDWDRLLSSGYALEQKLLDHYDAPDKPGVRWSIWRFWKRDRGIWQTLIDDEVLSILAAMPAISCEKHDLADAMVDYLVEGCVVNIDRNGDPRVWTSPVKMDFDPDMPLSKVQELWTKQEGITEKTKKEFNVAVTDFVSFADDPPIGRIEKYLLDKYCELAATLPASLPRKIRALAFRQRVAWAERERPDAPRIKPHTLKKRIGAVSAMVSFAHEKNIIMARPKLNVKIPGYTRGDTPRRLFSSEEIGDYFSAPLFTNEDMLISRSTDAHHLTAAWVSLIALTIGCRLTEAAQLLTGDVQIREGVFCLIFTEEQHDTGEKDRNKKYKTQTIYVAIPIPQFLIDLHFLHFVKCRQQAGASHLFPELFSSPYRIQKLSDFLNAHIDKYVSKNKNLVFHSLRHWFKSKARTVMGDEKTREVQKHSPESASEGYGRGDIQALKFALDKISYDALPVDKIRSTFEIVKWLNWEGR